MAIFGVGSNWQNVEIKKDFFDAERFILGWSYEEGEDLYDAICSLKAGDIIYIKTNQPGSRTIKVKGIGLVKMSFIHTLLQNEIIQTNIKNYESLYIDVKWLVKDEFVIQIKENIGRLTNVRASSFYEENLPFVQDEILKHIINICNL